MKALDDLGGQELDWELTFENPECDYKLHTALDEVARIVMNDKNQLGGQFADGTWRLDIQRSWWTTTIRILSQDSDREMGTFKPGQISGGKLQFSNSRELHWASDFGLSRWFFKADDGSVLVSSEPNFFRTKVRVIAAPDTIGRGEAAPLILIACYMLHYYNRPS